MNPNQRFCELAGIKPLCRGKCSLYGNPECLECSYSEYPDFAAEPWRVWNIFGKDMGFRDYLFEKGWIGLEKRGAIDLVFADTRLFMIPGLLRDKAIEWMEWRKG